MKIPDVLALAERGIESLDCGQVTVRWDGSLTIVVVAVVEGRAGRAEGVDGLPHLVKVAQLRARQARAWPAPDLPEPHETVAECGAGVIEAVANTRGLRAAQSFAPALAAAAREPRAGRGDVAGPGVVAEALARLRDAFGVRLALGEQPPALAPSIDLVDDSSVGLARAFDAEGVQRRRVTLMEAGVFVGGVHDSASPAPSTGHATRALTLAPRADNLVIAPGVADLGVDGGLPAVDLAAVVEVGAEPSLVALRGGGCALVPSVRIAR